MLPNAFERSAVLRVLLVNNHGREETRMMLRFLSGLVLVTGCLAREPEIDTDFPPVAVAGHVQVRIAADDASVRVFTADVSEVEMHARSVGYDVKRDLELSITPAGDAVEIVARIRDQLHLFDFEDHSLHIEVRVPRDADIEVSTGDGSVEVESAVGTVDIGTGDGDVTVRGAKGSVQMQTGDGSITAFGLDGRVEATTSDGRVDLDGRFDVLTVSTGDGDLVVTAVPGSQVTQPWHLQSGDGSVRLGLPRDLGAHIDASTRDGGVHSTIPLAQSSSSGAQGDINGGGLPIVVRTGDGSIELLQQ
jgi:hypothetical protein